MVPGGRSAVCVVGDGGTSQLSSAAADARVRVSYVPRSSSMSLINYFMTNTCISITFTNLDNTDTG